MQRLHFLLSILLVASLLSRCAPSSRPIEVQSLEKSASPTASAPFITDAANLYLNCLSPVLKMNVERAARAAHTATLLPDGRVLIAGGFREEGTSEIAIASAEIFDPSSNSFT